MINCCNCGADIPHGKTLWCSSLEDEAACSKWCETEHADRGCPHETINDYRTPEWYELNGLEFGGGEMNDYSMSAYELANALYAKSDSVGVPLHNRPSMIREAWIDTARRMIAAGTVSMDDIPTGTAH